MKSAFCTQKSFDNPDVKKIGFILDPTDYLKMHRKLWEWCFIAEALRVNGMLRPGKAGIGFAVGTEPLVSFFASFGAELLATDLAESEAEAKGWVITGQHSSGKEKLQNHFCTSAAFGTLVDFQELDMTQIPERLDGQFDFAWSSCALEHLGTIDKGLDFVLNALDCLKPGGIAVHTTEFNVTSDSDTIEEGETVLYRRSDFERLIARAAEKGWTIDMDWSLGTLPLDYHVDVPPYSNNYHLKLRIDQFTSTSAGIILHRSNAKAPDEASPFADADRIYRL